MQIHQQCTMTSRHHKDNDRRPDLLLAPLAAALIVGLFGDALAATISVDVASSGSAGGRCTLLDAVAAVNTATRVHGCVAGNGNDDTIDLTSFKAATAITFTSAVDGNSALVLSKPVTIRGALDSSKQPLVSVTRSTVSGTPSFRLISTNSDLTIIGLAVSNGNTASNGGAIYAVDSAHLTLSYTTATGNSAVYGGAVYEGYSGTVTIDHSSLSGNSAARNGGAIIGRGTGGTVALTNSRIIGNTAMYSGGGVEAQGLLSLSNTTISGNTARDGDGGGVIAYEALEVTGSMLNGNTSGSHGGAIDILVGTSPSTLTNSTITGNTAKYSGGGVSAPSANLYFCTVFGNRTTTTGYNGSGLYFLQSASITASIITGNGTDDLDAPYNIPVAGSYNIVGISGVSTPSDTRSCDVKLGPLGDFGGPTRTLPLLTGSCAIDSGPSSPSVLTDQRGDPRPAQLRADVGAFEKQGPDDPDIIFFNGFD
jgi:hypothetical protein